MRLTKEITDRKVNFEFNKEFINVFNKKIKDNDTEFLDKTLKELPLKGIKKIHILSPGFSSDCLETLKEIEIENKENFISTGGKKYNYIKCLNDNPHHLNMLAMLILKHTKGWSENNN